MINTRTLTSFAAAVLGLTMMAPNCPTCGPHPGQVRPSNAIITASGLTKPQFDALPANAIVMQKGMRTTKGEIIARAAKERADANGATPTTGERLPGSSGQGPQRRAG